MARMSSEKEPKDGAKKFTEVVWPALAGSLLAGSILKCLHHPLTRD
jgi:hypothetical protein